VAVSISAELSPDWALGVYAASCDAATELAHKAYKRLIAFD
jgi:hypothetical protein